MSSKEDLRVQRTRKLLSDTLLDMMETESIEHISVIDLCNLAMINRGTFYKHFDDKYGLLGFALEELKRDLYTDFAKNRRAEDSPQEAIRSFFATTIEFFFSNSCRIANIVKNNMSGAVVTAIEDSISSSLFNLILEYTDRYTVKVPLQLLVHFLAGGFVTSALWSLERNPGEPYDAYLDYLGYGCLTPLFEKI